jgi:starch synthase
MKIAFVTSEAVPFAKTGGLADVAGSLPASLAKLGCEVKLFMPKYFQVDEVKHGLHYNWDIGEMQIRVAGHPRSVHLLQAKVKNSISSEETGVEANFIDCPQYYHRGNIYSNHPDEDERFILLCKGVVESLQRLQWVPDIIHCNDWQTGLLPLLVKDNYGWDRMFDNTAFLFTIHNIGYQGRFSKDTILKAEINGKYFYPGGPVEFENDISFMKTGILFSEIINTVSKTYAEEILTPEYGAGMDSALNLKKDDLYGIINGVDYNIWNPENDKLLPFRYSIHYLTGKLKNKKFLLEHAHLPFDENIPLIGIISRLVSQKGFDIFSEAAEKLIELPVQWAILGSGEDRFEDLFTSMAHRMPNQVFTYIGYNNELAHLIEAASDMFLMPSHYEPCGLNQIYSLKYGTVPIVRKTGGLADTVQDWHESLSFGHETGTGFSFNEYTSHELFSTVERALETFNDKITWKKIQKNGMGKDYSWEKSAKEYIELYKEAVKKRI